MFCIDDDARAQICRTFNKTEEEILEDIKTVKRWMKRQTLPEIMEDVKIRNFLQLNKFNVDKTKEKIEGYYTMRPKVPVLFTDMNPKLPNIQRVLDTTYFCVHPKTINGSRVMFIKWKKPNVLHFLDLSKLALCIFELRLFEDCMIDEIFIADMENLTLSDMLSINPKFLYYGIQFYQKAFSMRAKAIYLLNAPVYVSILMNLLRVIVKKKIYERFHVHRDAEIVKELFESKDLPKDYGGEGPSLDELNENLRRKFVQCRDIFEKNRRVNTNENLRRKFVQCRDIFEKIDELTQTKK